MACAKVCHIVRKELKMICGLDDEQVTSIMLGSIVFLRVKSEGSSSPVELTARIYMLWMS